ncbi:MAG: HAMP domain-containing sensor histidine kinase [Variovorax sp.]
MTTRKSKEARPSGLGDFIRNNLEPILQEWEDFARSLVPLADLDPTTLRDHVKEILLAAVDDMQTPQSQAEQAKKSKGKQSTPKPSLTRAAQSHAVARLGEQFTLDQLIAEFRAIRASVLRHWALSGEGGDTQVEELTRFNEAIDQALSASVASYATNIDESRGMILGVLAHDLRNPLNAVSLSIQYILRSGSTDAASTKAAARALGSVDRMDGLIRDLLDFTRARLGTGLSVRPAPASLGLLCTKIAEEVEASYPGRHVRCNISGDVDGEWDAMRVSQMLTNLLANALHHGDAEGDVTLTLTGNDAEVFLEVHNNGPAIPERTLATMFQPLNRAALDRRGGASESSGLGLGLYIASEIATAHKGSLQVRSTDADGTTFTARLPRHAAAPK